MRQTLFLLRRRPQDPNRVPFKVDLPLALRNRVTGKGTTDAERGCLHEISIVLSCLEKNNFEDKLCKNEVGLFHKCYENYRENTRIAKEQSRKGLLTPNTKNLTPPQLNMLLRKYPHV